MELYFKDLISKESTLEKLVDDLSLLVQGADDFAKAVAPNLPREAREEVVSRVDRLKENCQRIKHQAAISARATDKFLRKYHYSSLAAIFALGLVVGTKARSRRSIHSRFRGPRSRWLNRIVAEEISGRIISSFPAALSR
jgi:ElaB/YqjD/DUF883 family membrane-anchored ribosome-binding protein